MKALLRSSIVVLVLFAVMRLFHSMLQTDKMLARPSIRLMPPTAVTSKGGFGFCKA